MVEEKSNLFGIHRVGKHQGVSLIFNAIVCTYPVQSQHTVVRSSPYVIIVYKMDPLRMARKIGTSPESVAPKVGDSWLSSGRLAGTRSPAWGEGVAASRLQPTRSGLDFQGKVNPNTTIRASKSSEMGVTKSRQWLANDKAPALTGFPCRIGKL